MQNRIIGLAVLTATLTWPAAWSHAAITGIRAEQVPQSVVPNVVVNDLLIDFTGNLRGQQLMLELESGSVFYRGGVPVLSPPTVWPPIFPADEYSTYFSFGRPNPNRPDTVFVQSEITERGFNVAWAPGTGVDISGPQDDYFIGRVTLSNDAVGTVSYFGSVSAGTGDPLSATGTIQNGVISFVPEPTTLVLLAFSILALIANPRRLRCSQDLPG